MLINSTIVMHLDLVSVTKGLGRFFYLVDPHETSFPSLSSVPDHLSKPPISYFLSLIALEWTLLWAQGRAPRINDGLLNLIHGLISSMTGLFWEAALWAGYIHIYNHYRLVDLPWDSMVTWLMAALCVDFVYYWLHRAAHEVNFFWAAHQVHHSSEDYNLSTALRQSAFQPFGSYLFWVSPALFLPASHMMIHRELNLLWQFWLHTELISSLGPLELIFNSPSHHRVHHGSNRYCLDSNYGGVLIIWDRIFGTFAREKKYLTYGLVDQPQWFQPIRHQLFLYHKAVQKAVSMSTWKDSLYSLIGGPGWYPGTARLGDPSMVPEKPVRDRYNPPTSSLLHIYIVSHFIISLAIVTTVGSSSNTSFSMSWMLYVLWTFFSIGLLYDNSRWAWPSELVRCGTTLLITVTSFLSFPVTELQPLLLVVNAGSVLVAAIISFSSKSCSENQVQKDKMPLKLS